MLFIYSKWYQFFLWLSLWMCEVQKTDLEVKIFTFMISLCSCGSQAEGDVGDIGNACLSSIHFHPSRNEMLLSCVEYISQQYPDPRCNRGGCVTKRWCRNVYRTQTVFPEHSSWRLGKIFSLWWTSKLAVIFQIIWKSPVHQVETEAELWKQWELKIFL